MQLFHNEIPASITWTKHQNQRYDLRVCILNPFCTSPQFVCNAFHYQEWKGMFRTKKKGTNFPNAVPQNGIRELFMANRKRMWTKRWGRIYRYFPDITSAGWGNPRNSRVGAPAEVQTGCLSNISLVMLQHSTPFQRGRLVFKGRTKYINICFLTLIRQAWNGWWFMLEENTSGCFTWVWNLVFHNDKAK